MCIFIIAKHVNKGIMRLDYMLCSNKEKRHMNGGSIMNITESNMQDENLLLALDKGIEDMENGRELPLDDAFDLIAELVEKRKSA